MSDTKWARAQYLDASALIKLVVDEGDHQPIRNFFNSNTNFFTTSLCMVEALGRIKGMWKKGKRGINKLSTEEYYSATRRLVIDVSGKRIQIDEMEFLKLGIHGEVEQMARKHNLDLSDALQLVTILKGTYSILGPNSASLLITADGSLAKAARLENIRCWNCIVEPQPA